MSLSLWAIPSSSGDYRLVANKRHAGRSVLTVTDPTDKEAVEINDFLAKARERGWHRRRSPVKVKGKTRVDLQAPVAECGLLLNAAKLPDKTVLTQITSEDGSITAVVTNERGAPEAVKANEVEEAADAAGDNARAVSVRRGTVSCPNPRPGPLARSSRILRLFSTRKQWSTWVARAFIDCVGGVTGRRYRVYHRHHPHAVALRQPIVDIDMARVVSGRAADRDKLAALRGCTLHRWDYSVPPAEEVLAAILILQQREAWIRNRAGANARWIPELLPNPIGSDVLDGSMDSALIESVYTGFTAGMSLVHGMN